jgi:hypothetical protein
MYSTYVFTCVVPMYSPLVKFFKYSPTFAEPFSPQLIKFITKSELVVMYVKQFSQPLTIAIYVTS